MAELPDFPSDPVRVDLPRGVVVYLLPFAPGIEPMWQRVLLESVREDADPLRAERAYVALVRVALHGVEAGGEEVPVTPETVERIVRMPSAIGRITTALQEARAAWAEEGNGSAAGS